MRQNFALIVTIIVVLVLLIVLNAASYVSTERLPDTEFNPDRSTYNAGATGTRALYDLLSESGQKVIRWQETPHGLLTQTGENRPSTFVIIGKARIPFDKDEIQSLMKWVEYGGRLVIIDRTPDPRLLPSSDSWNISAKTNELPRSNVHPNNTDEMTAGVSPVRPSQPSLLTRNVESVMPSRFAGAINVSTKTETTQPRQSPTPVTGIGPDDDEEDEDLPPPPPVRTPPKRSPTPAPTPKSVDEDQPFQSPAPIAYLEDHRGALLLDYPHGAGRIIVLSDPYIVANGGLRLADNLQLAINTVASAGGLIAFDEYHQGRAASRNQLIAYFAGTPILWMVVQGALLVLVILWTRGRRFARPLPLVRVDRRSSLEFVASMAELQQRARAYDLAIENIYTRLRRVLVRQAGLSHNSPRSEIAARAAARSEKLNAAELETLMRECEDAINGAPLDTQKALELVRRLRRIERILGLRVRSREARQAAEGLQQNSLL
jgi:Domain of unknown function (DUF4350)